MIGINDLSRRRSRIKNIRVVAIIIQPDFILETFVNDIALFRLRKPVRYNDYIQPICLPFGILQKLDQNTTCFISGWGRTKEEGNYSLNSTDTHPPDYWQREGIFLHINILVYISFKLLID